ncbi:hypothetical protein INR49_001614 [Caranx melampygus]|nr:hypothetical protein INR49_001614 [Caranx melampygus]
MHFIRTSSPKRLLDFGLQLLLLTDNFLVLQSNLLCPLHHLNLHLLLLNALLCLSHLMREKISDPPPPVLGQSSQPIPVRNSWFLGLATPAARPQPCSGNAPTL